MAFHQTTEVELSYLGSSESPWSEIISKYLNGTAKNQQDDHCDLIDFGNPVFSRENDDSGSTETRRKRHHHKHSRHRHHHRHQLILKKKSSRVQSTLPLSEQFAHHTDQSYINNNNNNIQQQQSVQAAVYGAPPEGQLVWTTQPTLATSVAPSALIFSHQFQSDLVVQPTPCYLTVPVKPGANIAAHNLLPIHKNPSLIPMVMNRGHNPYPTTGPEYLNCQNQQQSRETYFPKSFNHCNEHMASTVKDSCGTALTAREEEIIFSGMSGDIFSSDLANGLNCDSAEEAEERYQQLYETERRRSRFFRKDFAHCASKKK